MPKKNKEIETTGFPRQKKGERLFVEIDEGTSLDRAVRKLLKDGWMSTERVPVMCDDEKERMMYEPNWNFIRALNKSARVMEMNFAIWSKNGDHPASRLITHGDKQREELNSLFS